LVVLSLESMILKRGITSFFNWDDRGVIPELSFTEFKRILFAAAATPSMSVGQCVERSVTPNFHSALLRVDGSDLSILGHSTYPIFAFAQPWQPNTHVLAFVDCSVMALEITRLFPDTTVATSEEMNRLLTETDLTELDTVELTQIQYWKPRA